MKGIRFEEMVLSLLSSMGLDVEGTNVSGDGGIDIIAYNSDPVTGGKYIVQCKDWTKPVGEPAVRDLYGVLHSEAANKAILITTSSFTEPAKRFALGKQIELIDGDLFLELQNYHQDEQRSEDSYIFDDEYINELVETINEMPSNIEKIKELSDIYILKCEYAKAKNQLTKILSLGAPQADILAKTYYIAVHNLGVLFAKELNFVETIKLFNIMEKGISPYMGMYRDKARLYHYLGFFDKAIDNYDIYFSTNEKLIEIFEDEYKLSCMNIELDYLSMDVYFSKKIEKSINKIYELLHVDTENLRVSRHLGLLDNKFWLGYLVDNNLLEIYFPYSGCRVDDDKLILDSIDAKDYFVDTSEFSMIRRETEELIKQIPEKDDAFRTHWRVFLESTIKMLNKIEVSNKSIGSELSNKVEGVGYKKCKLPNLFEAHLSVASWRNCEKKCINSLHKLEKIYKKELRKISEKKVLWREEILSQVGKEEDKASFVAQPDTAEEQCDMNNKIEEASLWTKLFKIIKGNTINS
jgi:tetratricopeptide (TPR) repeat protein